jgi:hypothetical protein
MNTQTLTNDTYMVSPGPRIADRPASSRKRIWAGRIISVIPVLMLGSSGIDALIKLPVVLEGLAKLGYSESVLPIIGILELACVALYIIPQTAIFGALFLTAYLGGATASHVRIGDPAFVMPVLFGVIVWAGLFLRDRRLQSLFPKSDSRP